MVQNSLFPFPPEFVQFIEEQLQLGLAHLPISAFNKVSSVIIDLLGNPEASFRNKSLVAGAKVNMLLVGGSVDLGLH